MQAGFVQEETVLVGLRLLCRCDEIDVKRQVPKETPGSRFGRVVHRGVVAEIDVQQLAVHPQLDFETGLLAPHLFDSLCDFASGFFGGPSSPCRVLEDEGRIVDAANLEQVSLCAGPVCSLHQRIHIDAVFEDGNAIEIDDFGNQIEQGFHVADGEYFIVRLYFVVGEFGPFFSEDEGVDGAKSFVHLDELGALFPVDVRQLQANLRRFLILIEFSDNFLAFH